MKDTNKIISSLCYFSIFFAGFILPIAVYFIVEDEVVKGHARSAFVSHLIPLITIPVFIISGLITGSGDVFGVAVILGFLIAFIVNIVVIIWNVIKGITVLKDY